MTSVFEARHTYAMALSSGLRSMFQNVSACFERTSVRAADRCSCTACPDTVPAGTLICAADRGEISQRQNFILPSGNGKFAIGKCAVCRRENIHFPAGKYRIAQSANRRSAVGSRLTIKLGSLPRNGKPATSPCAAVHLPVSKFKFQFHSILSLCSKNC